MAKSQSTSTASNKNLSIDDLAAQIEALKEDLNTLTQTLSEVSASKSEAAIDMAKDKTREAQLQAEEFVRTQPATSLGLAAGLGFLVGMITARR